MDTATNDETEVGPPANGTKEGAGKARSETPYPYFGLGKMADIVSAVRRAGGNEAAVVADVLRELNVSKTDRLWAYGIPTAILFGLVERIGRGDDARIKLTPLGLRLALPGALDEERATKIAAFKTPDLYTKLWEMFAGHPVPEKGTIRRLLVRDFKIVESMAGNAADAFIESLNVAGLINAAGLIAVEGSAPPDDKASKPPVQQDHAKPGMQMITVPSDFIVYKAKIGGGRVIDVPLPRDFTESDAKRLHAFLLTQVDDNTPPATEDGGAV